jgi:hypothetical protein
MEIQRKQTIKLICEEKGQDQNEVKAKIYIIGKMIHVDGPKDKTS